MPGDLPTLNQVASVLGLAAPTGQAIELSGVASLDEAGAGDLSFVSSEQYLPGLATTQAAGILISRRLTLPPSWKKPALVVDDVELALVKVLALFAPAVPAPAVGVDASARVDPTARVAPTAAIGFHAIVGARASIGQRSVIHPNVFIGDDVTIGDDCQIFPNVVIRERIAVGDRVTIHASSVLGSDGFGYRWDGRQHAKVPQIGTVIVEDDVEIGSCVCIDRAKVSATRIGRGTKIDNLVQIGHNVQVGPHCIIVGQAGVAGSARLGAGVVLGGQCAIRDHVQVGDGAMLAACSGIIDDVPPKAVFSGTPALPHRQSLREQAALRRLPDVHPQIRKLQQELDALQKRIAELDRQNSSH